MTKEIAAGISVEDLLSGRRELEISFPRTDLTILITYNPRIWTDTYRAGRLTQISTSQGLEDVILEWDLTRDGEPIPIEVEAIGQIPSVITNKIFYAIGKDINTGKAIG